MKLFQYIKEMEYLKFYILAISIPLILSYSIYAYMDASLIRYITDEDMLFEWWTVIFFLVASGISLKLFIKIKNIYFLIFCLAFFFVAGEEISWGQRIFGFNTPELFAEKNVQEELTLHNLELFNTIDLDGQYKKGLSRLLEINFLFKLGTIGYGIILPLLVFHFSFVKRITKSLKIPVPPVSIGIFFIINWIIFRLIHTSMDSYPGGGDEIFECIGALILMLICIFYYLERKRFNYIGDDIKNSIEEYPEVSILSFLFDRGNYNRTQTR